MKKPTLDRVRFAAKGDNSFHEAVLRNVKEYFDSRKMSPFANSEMWIKTASMLMMYFVPYALIVSGLASVSIWLFLGCWLLMAFGMSGIGTSVMHDANHGTYSANPKVNNTISRILDMIGGYRVTWRIQHNLLHHTYTNVAGLDEDIGSTKLLRLSPRLPVAWFHRYQYVYAWLLYGMMTLFWMTVKDYKAVFRYNRHQLLSNQKVTLLQALQRVTFYKLFYYAYILVLPLLFSGMPWWLVLIGFFSMHVVSGLVLSSIFQPAHVIENSEYAAPVMKAGMPHMENSWAIHEVVNTTNFAPRNAILTWFAGGLNFQIEHHLFTNICHVHYRKLAPIVKATCLAYHIPYHSQPTFRNALWEHTRMLRKLGRA